jgi:hypothetical protein
MVVTDFEGKLIEGKYKAPSEVYMHARAYKARADVQSVAHLHNHMVVVLTMVDKPFYPASSNPGLLRLRSDACLHGPRPDSFVEQGTRWLRPWEKGRGHAARSRLDGRRPSDRMGICGCVDLEEAASRFYSVLAGPVRSTANETQRTIKARRKDSVVRKSGTTTSPRPSWRD